MPPTKDSRALGSDIEVTAAVIIIDLVVIKLRIGEVGDKKRLIAPYLPRYRLIREL
jgi:hypothetical protein